MCGLCGPVVTSSFSPRRGRSNQEHLMAEPKHIDVVRRAFHLWQQAGQPEGKDEEFYLRALQELRNEDKSSPVRTRDNL